jgi:hypothetical protein
MSILDEAKSIIEGDREQTYGNPGINLRRIADQWSCYLNQKYQQPNMLSEEDVCWMMVLLVIIATTKNWSSAANRMEAEEGNAAFVCN